MKSTPSKSRKSLFAAFLRIPQTVQPVRLLLSLGLLSVGLGLAPTQADASTRPNILIFFVDDMGWGDSGVYDAYRHDGKPAKSKMPNVDTLASDGMTFLEAHSPAAVCAPTRYSMLSGNYPWRSRENEGIWSFNGNTAFLDDQKSIAEVLRNLSTDPYRTAMFGKHHMGGLVQDQTGGYHTTGRYSYKWWEMDFTQRIDNDLSVDPSNPTGPHNAFDYTYLTYNGIQGEPFAYFEDGWIDMTPPGAPSGPARSTVNGLLFDWPFGYYNYDNPSDPDNDAALAGFGSYDGNAIGGKTECIVSAGNFGLSYWRSSEIGSDLLTKALAFLGDHNTNHPTEPFFMHYCTPAVHKPHVPPTTFHGVAIEDQGNNGVYTTGTSKHLDMLYEVDVALGKLIDYLELTDDPRNPGSKLIDNTLIIFTSDNGGLGPNNVDSNGASVDHMAAGGLRGSKSYIYQGGLKVPFIVRWGDGTAGGSMIAPGSTASQMISLTDVFATIADIVDTPSDATLGRDSRSLADVLLNNSADPIHDYLLFQDFDQRGPLKALREGDYKLITGWSGGAIELYDLATDPTESTNLVDDAGQATRIQRMEDKLDEIKTSYRTTPVDLPLNMLGTAPADISGSNYTSDSDVYMIEEKTVQLASDLDVDVVNPADMFMNSDSTIPGGTIAQRTNVKSYLLHYAPVGNGVWGGSWTFDEPILGLIFDDTAGTDRLDNTDSIFGLSGVTYPTGSDPRSSITERGDSVWVSPDGKTLSVAFRGNEETIDELTVANADFEAATDWAEVGHPSYSGNTPSQIVTGAGRNGGDCMQFGQNANEAWHRIQQVVSGETWDKTATYRLEAWIRRIPGNDDGMIGLRLRRSGSYTVKQLAMRTYSDKWTQVMLEIRPHHWPASQADGGSIRIEFFRDANYGLDGVYLDDVTFKKIPQPANGGMDQMRVLVGSMVDEDPGGPDTLGDTWEMENFGNLDTAPTDLLADGQTTAFLAYALAMNPSAGDFSQIDQTWDVLADNLTVNFSRANDPRLDFTYWFSNNLSSWDLGVADVDYELTEVANADPTLKDVTVDVIRPNTGQLFMKVDVVSP